MTRDRGFLLHELLINADNLEANDGSATGSSYSQAGSRPGLPEPGDPLGTFLPHAHHAQAADLEVVALRPGAPGSAGLGYREPGEAAASTRGWNEPNLVQGYWPVQWGTAPAWFRVDAVTCPVSQKVVVAASDSLSSEPISTWVWDPTARAWSARVEPDASSPATCCAVTVLRSTGRVLLFAADTTTGAAAVYYSDDDGSTWSDYAPAAMPPGTIDVAVDQVRMVEDRNGVLLLVALITTTGQYWQYASADRGTSWQQVETGTLTLRSLSMAVLPGSVDPASPILVVYRNAATSSARSRLLSDAYDPISGATPAAIDGTNAVDAVQVALDADGIAWALLSADSSDQVKVARLDGDSWTLYTEHLLQMGGGVADPTDHHHLVRACAWSGGELVALFTSVHTATLPDTDGSLVSLVCGGWSNLEAADDSGARAGRHSFADPSDTDGSGVWLPTELLDNQGWTSVGTAETLSAGYHRFNPTGALSYQQLTPAHSSGAYSVLFEAQVVAGGSVSADDCSFHLARRDGSLSRPLTIRFSTTQFRVIDAASGTTLTTVDLDMATDLVQFLVNFSTIASVTVHYRTRSSSVWTQAVIASIASDPTASSTDLLQVGCRAATTSDMRVGLIALMHHAQLRGLTGGRRLQWGKAASAIPYPVRDQVDDDGRVMHLSAGGGAARFQESWELPAEYDHGVRELHPVESPKPRATWRSTSSTVEQVITWDLGADTRLGAGGGVGLALVRPNFGRAVLEVSTSVDPTTWSELGEWNSRVIASTFVREGRLLLPAPDAARGSLYLGDDWLRGGFAVLDPGGPDEVAVRIAGNAGGSWGGDGAAVLELEGIDGTEPTSGTVHVYMPGGVLVLRNPAPEQYRRVRLRIPVQPCPEGYIELGAVVLGSLWAPGQQWSRGWSVRTVPVVSTEEDGEGTVYVDLRTDEGLVYRREITVAWQDGSALAALRAQLAQRRRGQLADRGDVWFKVQGLLGRSRGAKVPSVALLEIPREGGMVLDPTLHSYGRLGAGAAWQVNHVQGDEGRSEIMRGEPLVHVEL